MRFFYFLARNTSYTFAVSFLTIFGGWFGAVFAFFLGTSFIIWSSSNMMGYLITWLPVAAGTVSMIHYLLFGMLSRIGIPAAFASLRTINRYFSGAELDRTISDDELKRLHVYVSDFPLYNMLASVFSVSFGGSFLYPILIYCDMWFHGAVDMTMLRLIFRLSAVSAMVVWILHGMSTYLLSEIITSRERATCLNELIDRGLSVRPRSLIGIRLKFGFFIILLVITLLTFAALLERNRFFLDYSMTYVVLYSLVAVTATIALTWVNAQSVLRVLREMSRVSRSISAGEQAKFKSLSVDNEFSAIEFGMIEMSREINEHRKNLAQMVEQRTFELQHALSDLKERDDLIQKQLDIASTIQRGILPGKIDDWNELRFSTRYIAMEKIGGDFYDVFQLRNNKLGLLVADVSGHGIPAALLTTMAKISFGNACLKHDSPRRIFQEVNQSILEHVRTQDYLTCFFVAIDEDYNLSYANASHQKAILLRTIDGKTELLDTNGLFIGAIEDARDTYEEKTTRLNYNDRLILYTDGIPEAINAERQEYSMERFEAVVLKNRSLPIEDFTSSIIEDVQRFIANTPVADDITLLVVELARDEAVDIIKTSKRLVAENKYYEAIDHIERGLSLYPDNRKLMYNLAKSHFRVNNYEQAAECIRRYTEHDKRNKYAYYIGGAAYYQMGDFNSAVEMLENAMGLDQNFVNAVFALGMAYKKMRNRPEAARCFERVVTLDPDNKLALYELSELKKSK